MTTETRAAIKAPFPYFGGKSRVAADVWAHLGDVKNYIEPFFGSGAVLLGRPHAIPGIETVNDIDALLANFWRAAQADPDAVAHHADWPVSEVDLHARHWWLINRKQSLAPLLEADPDAYDAQAAGWWVWGLCGWIGSGWCSGDGPWQVVDGRLIKVGGPGLRKKLPDMGGGRGVNRKLPHLANAGRGINRQLPHLACTGRGVNRNEQRQHLHDYMGAIAARLRRVRVACGDWTRVLKPAVTTHHGTTGVFLDPPYGDGLMEYSAGGNADKTLAAAVRAWAIAHGDDPLFRIALAGYDDLVMPAGWTLHRWSQRKGYAKTAEARENARREVIWFSPHCLKDAYQ